MWRNPVSALVDEVNVKYQHMLYLYPLDLKLGALGKGKNISVAITVNSATEELLPVRR